MRRVPVRWRLTAGFSAVMACLLVATGLFVQQRLQSDLDGSIDRSLRARAADVAALAQQSDSGLKDARPAAGQVELAQLIDRSGQVLDRTPGLSRLPLLSPARLAAVRDGHQVRTEATLSDRGGPVRLLAQPVRAQDQTLVVVVGQSLADRNQAVADLGDVLALGGLCALLLATGAGYLQTGFALRPVEAMRRRAAAISLNELDRRLPPAGGQDELGRLGRTLNDMLARIETSVLRERTLVADASHELRTPLAILRAELELIAIERPTGHMLQVAVDSAIDETERLTGLADDLLLLARADHDGLVLERSERPVAELLEGAAGRGRHLARGTRTQITVDAAPELRMRVDPARMAQALDNLVANALRYARGHVELSARARPGIVELHVVDDGPGFPATVLPGAWERFARAEAGRTDDGAGLGLSIVRTIAEAHDGEAHAANAPGGGAAVWITLPALVTPRPAGARPARSRTPA